MTQSPLVLVLCLTMLRIGQPLSDLSGGEIPEKLCCEWRAFCLKMAFLRLPAVWGGSQAWAGGLSDGRRGGAQAGPACALFSV